MSARYGRASQTDPANDMLREGWERASKLPHIPAGGEYVPWEAIKVDDRILPRERQDDDAVEQYAAMIDDLPPIVVQRDTFVLIEGKHRLFAAPKAFRDHVRIVELDVPDDKLWERAFEENAAHGVRLTSRERTKAARRYLAQYPDYSDAVIAKWAGVHRQTVLAMRQKDEQRSADAGQVVEFDNLPAATRRTGADGKSYPAPAPKPSAGTSVTPSPKPKSQPATNGVHASPPPAQRAEFRSFADVLADALERSPRDAADETPAEHYRDQIEAARKAADWFNSYAEALEALAEVPF